MNEQDKQDLRNSLYRSKFVSDNGWDPGDIEGPQSSYPWVGYCVLAYLAWLTYAHLTT